MRKLTAGLFYSVDGVAEAPNTFQFDSFDDELGGAMGQLMMHIDTVVMGRVGWQDWARYWPKAKIDLDFAEFINGVPKYVASRTLSADDMRHWANSILIEQELVNFVSALKAQPGGTISLMGGMSLVPQLLAAGLIDELTLIVHPVIAGTGRRLFADGMDKTRLELISSEQTSKGNMVLTYAKRKA